jgi:hypothetical protein
MALTDDEIVAMTQQYTQGRGGGYVCHDAYDEINRQGGEGRQWTKCPNCGNPYPLNKPGANDTTCSSGCWAEYAAYVMNPFPDYDDPDY